MLKVYTKENKFENRKKEYSFHSRLQGRITQEEFVELVANAGSTVTLADTVAVLAAMETVFDRYIKDGYSVELPMGTFKAQASGSADTKEEHFKPRRGGYKGERLTDHKIRLEFRANRLKEKALASMRVERLKDFVACAPKISSVTAEQSNEDGEFFAGSGVTVRGEFLKIDLLDKAQGVWLCPADGSEMKEVTRFFRNARRTLIFMIPEDTKDGKYTIRIRVSPVMSILSCESGEISIVSR